MNQTHVDGVLRTFPKKEAGGKPKWNTNRNQKAPPTPRMTKLEKLQKKMEQMADYSEETVVVKKKQKLSKKKKELKKKKFEEKVTAKYGNVEHQMLGGDDSDSDYSTASVTDMLEPEVEEETTVPLAKSLKDMYGYVGEPTHEDNAAPQLRKKLKEQRKGKKKGVVESVKMEETEDDEGDEEIVVKQNGKNVKGKKKAETQITLKGKKKTVVDTQTVGQKGKRGRGKEMKEEVKEEMEESEEEEEEEEERGMIQKGKWMKEEMKGEEDVEEEDDDDEMDVSGYEMEPFGEQDEDSESDFEEQMNERTMAAKRVKREAKAMTDEASSDEDYGEGPEMEMDEDEMEEDDDFDDEEEEEEGGSSRPSRNMRPGLPGDSDSDFEQPPDEEDLQSPSFRQDLANMPLRKVQELKNKLGLKNFNKAYFGVTEEDKERERKMKQERRERVFERDTRHRPLEVTSKRPVSRFRNVYENDRTARKKQGFDPRFDPRCGEFEENVFESSYGFLKDIREKDKLTIRKAIQAAKKEEDTETVRRLRKTLRDMENQDKTKTEREMKRSTVRDLKKENIERLKQGLQPVYKTRADVRMMNTEKKFGQLKKEHRVDKYLKHQSKKQSMKGNMPAPRREYE